MLGPMLEVNECYPIGGANFVNPYQWLPSEAVKTDLVLFLSFMTGLEICII
jgi:hypothetical protein